MANGKSVSLYGHVFTDTEYAHNIINTKKSTYVHQRGKRFQEKRVERMLS
jgi:hypothetical protein